MSARNDGAQAYRCRYSLALTAARQPPRANRLEVSGLNVCVPLIPGAPGGRFRLAWRAGSLLAAAALLFAAGAPAMSSSAPVATRPITTVAIVGDLSINPLHREFRTAGGREPLYPRGMPAPIVVPRPQSGDFDEAMAELAEGPLGKPVPGRLYAIGGTRLLIYAGTGSIDLLAPGDNRDHGTATASAAAGLSIGTSPDSLIVHVPENDADGFEWLTRQHWIDVASTSVYSLRPLEPCEPAEEARALHRDGGLLFSSSGNTTDGYEMFSIPNGLPEVFQVGGTDRSGRTWLPGHLDEPAPTFAFGTVIRPYEVGARFSFPAADGDSLTASQPFGGTSGATPTVAGYALELIAEARRILQDSGPRTETALARGNPGRARPPGGPLSDGDLTRDELVDVLHHTATPFEAASPARYAVEGYGAFDARSLELAVAVVRGARPMPARPDEDAAHSTAEELRRAQAGRC